jgi:hypothetical protein
MLGRGLPDVDGIFAVFSCNEQNEVSTRQRVEYCIRIHAPWSNLSIGLTYSWRSIAQLTIAGDANHAPGEQASARECAAEQFVHLHLMMDAKWMRWASSRTVYGAVRRRRDVKQGRGNKQTRQP